MPSAPARRGGSLLKAMELCLNLAHKSPHIPTANNQQHGRYGELISLAGDEPEFCQSGNAPEDRFLSYVQQGHKRTDSESPSCIRGLQLTQETSDTKLLLRFRHVSDTRPPHLKRGRVLRAFQYGCWRRQQEGDA